MKIGYIYEKGEKEVKKDLEKGEKIEVGVSLNYLYNELNINEIKHPARPDLQLAQLKQDIMVSLGIIEIEDDDETKDKKN